MSFSWQSGPQTGDCFHFAVLLCLKCPDFSAEESAIPFSIISVFIFLFLRSYPLGSASALSAPRLPPAGSISRLNPSIADGIWIHLKAPDRFVVLRSSSGWVLGRSGHSRVFSGFLTLVYLLCRSD